MYAIAQSFRTFNILENRTITEGCKDRHIYRSHFPDWQYFSHYRSAFGPRNLHFWSKSRHFYGANYPFTGHGSRPFFPIVVSFQRLRYSLIPDRIPKMLHRPAHGNLSRISCGQTAHCEQYRYKGRGHTRCSSSLRVVGICILQSRFSRLAWEA